MAGWNPAFAAVPWRGWSGPPPYPQSSWPGLPRPGAARRLAVPQPLPQHRHPGSPTMAKRSKEKPPLHCSVLRKNPASGPRAGRGAQGLHLRRTHRGLRGLCAAALEARRLLGDRRAMGVARRDQAAGQRRRSRVRQAAAKPTVVMPGLDPGIHVLLCGNPRRGWPGLAPLRPAMTKRETGSEVVAR